MEPTKDEEILDQMDLLASLEKTLFEVTMLGAPINFEINLYRGHHCLKLAYAEEEILKNLKIDKKINARALKLNIFHAADFMSFTDD